VRAVPHFASDWIGFVAAAWAPSGDSRARRWRA
jgi:hypothetical protein